MNRSTLRAVGIGMTTAVFWLTLSGVAHAAQADPAGANDVIFGDGDEGPIYVGPVTATPKPNQVALPPGDVLFGDGDQGAIDANPLPALAVAVPAPAVAVPAPAVAAPTPAPVANIQCVNTDDTTGCTPVDLSAFTGRSNISSAELATGKPALAHDDAAEYAQQYDFQ